MILILVTRLLVSEFSMKHSEVLMYHLKINIKKHWIIYLLLLLLLVACLLTIIIAASEQEHMQKAKMWDIEKRKNNVECQRAPQTHQ